MMPEWVTVAKTDDPPEGEMIGATVDGLELLVANVGGQVSRDRLGLHARGRSASRG
jgi:nitrite reductase/ring-hydroxylating ferredoxin subunit